MDRAERTAFVSVLSHGGLIGVAAALGLLSGSAALSADAWLLAAGLAGSLLAWAGRRLSRSDRRAVPALPWNLLALIAAVGFLWAAVAIVRHAGGRPLSFLSICVGGAVGLAVATHLLARRESFIGREADDAGLIASGRHSRIAVVGSGLAVAGVMGERMGFPLDRAASLAIAGLVGASGIGLLASVAEGLRCGRPVGGILPVTIPTGPAPSRARGGGRLRTRARRVADALFHPAHRVKAASVAAAAVLVAWALTTLSFVGAGHVGVIAGRGGEREVGAGLHAKLPWPIERTERVKAGALMSVATHDVATGAVAPRRPSPVTARVLAAAGMPVLEAARAAPQPGDALCLTGDGRLVAVRAHVHYTVTDASALSLAASDPEAVIAAALEHEVVRVAACTLASELVGAGRRGFEESVAAGLATRLSAMGLGVRVRSVRVERAGPPPEAAAALARASAAADEAERVVVQEAGAAARAGALARLAAAGEVRAAEAYAADRVSRARAEAERFLLLAPEYRRAPGVTETRLYIEAMEALLADIEKTVVSSGLALEGYDPAAGDRAIARRVGARN